MRLIDCFNGLIAYAAYSMSEAETNPPALEDFKVDVDQLLFESEKLSQKGGFSDEEYDMSRFAVCALVDELVLCSEWPHKNVWEHQQLQRQYYQTTNAGEEFFERLETISPENRDQLETYAACLLMGFKGRYHKIRSLPDLEQINKNVVAKLMETTINPLSSEELKFFPEGYLDEGKRARKKREWGIVPTLVIGMIIAGGGISALYFILAGILNDIVEVYFQSGI